MSDEGLRIQAEEYLVSASVLLPSKLPSVHWLEPDAFQNPFFSKWWMVAKRLSACGELTKRRLKNELKKLGQFGIPEEDDFLRLTGASGAVIESDVEFFAQELQRLHHWQGLRQLVARFEKAIDEKSCPREASEHLRASLGALVVNQREEWRQAHEVAQEVYKGFTSDGDQGQRLAVTGLRKVDHETGGFYPGQVWMIAAKSFCGKTALALNLAQAVVDQGRGVYFASFEMQAHELLGRLYSSVSGVDLHSIVHQNLSTSQLESLLMKSQHWKDSYFCIDDRPPKTIEGLKAKLQLAQQSGDVSLVVIDHLLLIPKPSARQERHEHLVELTAEIKSMAKECGCAVLLLNQINISAEGRPTDADVSQSKNIKQNLDVSCLLHRETELSQDLLMDFTKNRMGRPFEETVLFDGEIQRVEDQPLASDWVA